MSTKAIQKIPKEAVNEVMEEYRNAGATDVKSEPDGPDTFTVTATFSDRGQEKPE